ncbi:MAG: NAD(+) synthase [Erysipelotrichaceae bacterium]|nr:NAD(+) synthase [Erysipelotrichaceae bacterium]
MFDAVKTKNEIVEFIREYYKKNNLKGAVLGISGGKDSGVVAGLMSEAIGPENVVGLTLPCHSKAADASDAQLVAEKFGFELINIDLTGTFDTFHKQIEALDTYSEEELKNSDINIKPRLRMATVYYMAALLSATRGGVYIVPGTSNACELYVGYFTKGGDSVYDIAPIYSLTVEEVIKVGEVVGVPEKVLYRTPDDGLSGLSDEDKLGVKYNDIAAVIRQDRELPEEVLAKIEKLHKGSAHKFDIPKFELK